MTKASRDRRKQKRHALSAWKRLSGGRITIDHVNQLLRGVHKLPGGQFVEQFMPFTDLHVINWPALPPSACRVAAIFTQESGQSADVVRHFVSRALPE